MLTNRLKKKWMTMGAAALFWTVSAFVASVTCACSLGDETGCSESSCCCAPETAAKVIDEHCDCLRCVTGSAPSGNAQHQPAKEATPFIRLPVPVLHVESVAGETEIPPTIPGLPNRTAGTFLPPVQHSTVILRI